MSDFPSEENPQPCKNGCGTKIYLSNKKEKNRWLPYEVDGTFHDCPKKQKNVNGDDYKKQEFTLEDVRKKLASIGVILNLERLMKE